ncbi:hypothetical protein GCM10008905_11560 [Clostridium malenominatum]|uniref:Iron-only hydrogenase system regulator n=1 Tax=Clostridium malenominatum TaxID=1539 RepID=A0ABP3U1K2_9CLOT
MDKTVIMGISIEPRNTHAPEVQEILTRHGCIIKTRIGMHETSEKDCSHKGIILLNLCGKDEDVKTLGKDLEDIQGVTVKTMEM